MSPLMYAAKEGRVKVCEKLLEQGAEINKQDMRGWTVSVVRVIMSPEDETSVCACFNFLETLGYCFSSFVPHRVLLCSFFLI